MKVKAKKLKERRRRNSIDAWYRVRPMNVDEATSAKRDIVTVLGNSKDGLYFGRASSPEDAILEQLPRRSKYGDLRRQRLVIQSVLNELKKLGAITYDPLRKLIGYRATSPVK